MLVLRSTGQAGAAQLQRQVFISHTGQDDRARVFAVNILKPALEAAGLSVFIDFTDLAPGSNWPSALVDAAAHSAVVVAVLSVSYVRHFWSMLELDLALHGTTKQQRENSPVVIPVLFNSLADILQPQGSSAPVSLKQLWQDKIAPGSTAVPADRQQYVDPGRWASNFDHVIRQLQNFSLRTDLQTKDAEGQLAQQVVRAAVVAMPALPAVPEGLVGDQQQVAEAPGDPAAPAAAGVEQSRAAAPPQAALGGGNDDRPSIKDALGELHHGCKLGFVWCWHPIIFWPAEPLFCCRHCRNQASSQGCCSVPAT